MHRSLGYISKRLFQVRAGEGRKVGLTFLYFCLIITAYYVIKPVSRSLVLGDLGSRLVPVGDLVSAILMGPMVALFARLVDRVEKHQLVSWTFWLVSGTLVLFWLLLQQSNPWISTAFYVWVSIVSVLLVTLFWLVANDIYHPREAKRLFGFIGSGGILGGVIGSGLAATGAKLFGTTQLLLLSACILLLSWAVVEALWESTDSVHRIEPAAHRPKTSGLSNLKSISRVLLDSRYLLLLVGLVGIAKIVSTLIYYQFNPFIEQMFPDQDQKTAFLGLYSGWVNVASFFVQFFFTSWVLRRLGLTSALLALPLGLLGGSIALWCAPGFWVGAGLELYDGSLNYSLQQTSKEVLYLPIDRSIRYKIKPFIDMIVFRFGKGIAAILGIVLLNVLHVPARLLCLITIPLIIAWMVLAVELRRSYVTTIRGILRARAALRRRQDRIDDVLSPEEMEVADTVIDDDPPDEPETWLESLVIRQPLGRKLALVSELFAKNGGLPADAKRLVEALADYEDAPVGLDDPPAETQALKERVSDRREPMARRRDAIRQLVRREDDQDTVDWLLGLLIIEEDAAIRHELTHNLTVLRLRHPLRLEFPKRLTRRQIGKEVKVYQRIIQIASLYRAAQDAGAPTATDPVLQLLRMLLEETAQQIFQLLSLIYRPEDIYLIYTQLREPEAYVRADAIELLDNLLDPGLRWLIFPVLDENRFLERFDGDAEETPDPKDVQRMLQQGIWDHHSWLSVVILSMIGRLRLEPMVDELDRAAASSTPLVSLAAKAARQIHPGASTR